MLTENLKTLRKANGLSQEELATRLNVVRQTVSKWEKGLSVPDADSLIRLAEIFEVSVSELLGAKIEDETKLDAVAEQLSRINEQLAIKNRRSRRIWKTVAIVFIAIIVINVLLVALSMVAFHSFESSSSSFEVIAVTNVGIKDADFVVDEVTITFSPVLNESQTVTITEKDLIDTIVSAFDSMTLVSTSRPMYFPRFTVHFYSNGESVALYHFDDNQIIAGRGLGNHILTGEPIFADIQAIFDEFSTNPS